MNTKLKPCPFCGSTDIKSMDSYMECLGCTAYGPGVFYGEDAEEQAMEAWNRRHGEKEAPDEMR